LDHFITLSNVILPLGFRSVGELGIKGMDMNSARSWSEDYRSSWTLCQSLSCFHIGKILQKEVSRTFFNEFGLTSHQLNSFDLSFDRSLCFWYEHGNSGKILQENASRTFFNEFGLISHQIDSFVFVIRSVTIWSVTTSWYERGNSGKVLQENTSRTFFNEFGLISQQVNSFDWSALLSLGRASIDRSNMSREVCHHCI